MPRIFSVLIRTNSPFVFLSILIRIAEIAEKTSIKKEDAVATLQNLGLIKYYQYQNVIGISKEQILQHEKMMATKIKKRIYAEYLKWTPKDWSKRMSYKAP